MRAVIAEKHSVAKAIATALGGGREHDGCIECDESVVTWAQGHLIELAEPSDYKEHDWKKWSLDTLPIDPVKWKWRLAEKGRQRYRAIAQVIARNDVDSVVNACDPDREGEAIFDRIMRNLRCDKPMLRLWVASLEAGAIKEAWQAMKPSCMYQGLRDAAEIRAKSDWLIGMNGSRAYSLLYNTRMVIGRVQTPTLAMVVERDLLIEHHRPMPFHTAVADMGGWILQSERHDTKTLAEKAAQSAQEGLRIVSVKRERVHDRPPRLYDLTGLQKDMSKRHGITAARTLTALQHLYELKLTTYPRTDSQYITHDDLPALETLLGLTKMRAMYAPMTEGRMLRPELTVNDSKVAGHTAILPTANAADVANSELSNDEMLVLSRVVKRMYEAVEEDRIRQISKVEATTVDGRYRFTANSSRTIEPGWSAIESGDNDEDEHEDAGRIPGDLEAGATIYAAGRIATREGKTTPPKRFTEATLLSAMEHASRYIDDKELKEAMDDDSSHSGGIGTPATRAEVVEKLLRGSYIERKGKHLISTPSGRMLIKVADPQLKDVACTARMEQALSDVEHGQADPRQVMEQLRAFALAIHSTATRGLKDECIQRDERRQYGPCPRCGEPVISAGKVWSCSTNKSERLEGGTWRHESGCGWMLYRNILGINLTESNVNALLSGRLVKRKGFVSKKGVKFEAALVVDAERGVRFVFDDPRGAGR